MRSILRKQQSRSHIPVLIKFLIYLNPISFSKELEKHKEEIKSKNALLEIFSEDMSKN